jgi:hypothetical protein
MPNVQRHDSNGVANVVFSDTVRMEHSSWTCAGVSGQTARAILEAMIPGAPTSATPAFSMK